MKKIIHSKIFRTLMILAIILFSIALFFQSQCRTIHSVIKENCEEIFIPNGIADAYNNLLTFSIDEHIIWEYKLNLREKKLMDEDLCNGIWDIISNKNHEEIKYFFTDNSDSYFPKDISNDSYYCIYDFSLKRFIGANEDVAILGWHRALFVYDKANACYYCVSKSI